MVVNSVLRWQKPARPDIERGIPAPHPCIACSTHTSTRSRGSGRSASKGGSDSGGALSTNRSGGTWIAASSRTGTLSQTAYHLRVTEPRVTVIRRHHPLEGQQLEVLAERGTRIDVRLRDGTSMRMPRSWTDADGPGVTTRSSTATTSVMPPLKSVQLAPPSIDTNAPMSVPTARIRRGPDHHQSGLHHRVPWPSERHCRSLRSEQP